MKINNDTIVGNRAHAGGGINETGGNGIEVVSTIIADNSARQDADVSGEIDASFDLIGKISAGLIFGADTKNLKNVNPQLGARGVHGGPAATMLPSVVAGKLSPVTETRHHLKVSQYQETGLCTITENVRSESDFRSTYHRPAGAPFRKRWRRFALPPHSKTVFVRSSVASHFEHLSSNNRQGAT